MALEFLTAEDPQVTDCLRAELARQRGSVELIASENFTSRAVMEAVGSVPHQQVRRGLSRQALLRRLREGRHGGRPSPATAPASCTARSTPTSSPIPVPARTSAHIFPSSSPATRCIGMSLDHGGHLTHGCPVNFSGLLYQHRLLRRRTPSTETDRLRRARAASPRSAARRSSSPAPRPTRASSTSSAWPTSPMRWAPTSWWTWPTSRASWPRGSTRARCPTPTSSPPRAHKTLRGPRGGFDPHELGRAWARSHRQGRLPGAARAGLLMHVIAGKAVCLRRGAAPRITVSIMEQIVENCRGPRRGH